MSEVQPAPVFEFVNSGNRLQPHLVHEAQSPYSWLTLEHIKGEFEELASIHAGRFDPEPIIVPVHLAALLASQGRQSWTLNQDRKKNMREVEQRAADELGITMKWPAPEYLPTNSLNAQRAAVLIGELLDSHAVYEYSLTASRAAFRHGQNLGDLGVVLGAVEEADIAIKPAEVEAEIKARWAKDRLRRNTDQAINGRLTGTPTVVILGSTAYWGDDHLKHAVRHQRDYLESQH